MPATHENQKRNNFAYEGLLDDAELDAALEGLDTIAPVASSPAVTTLIFDYSKISENGIRKQAQDAATRIRTNLNKAQAAFLDIGRDLLTVKDKLAHGEFGKWIEAEFGMTTRTAQNMMNAAELVSEYEAISTLSQTVIYKLAAKSTPVEIKAHVATQIENGTIPSSKEIEQQIVQAKHVAHQLKQITQQQKAVDRAQNDSELTWEDREKELRASGMDDLDINLVRKKWELEKTKKELSILKKQKREEEQIQEQTIALQREQEERETIATRAVAFLQDHLGDDFVEFLNIISNLNDVLMFEQALKAVDH